jgi:hypothetical protein
MKSGHVADVSNNCPLGKSPNGAFSPECVGFSAVAAIVAKLESDWHPTAEEEAAALHAVEQPRVSPQATLGLGVK